MVPDSEASGFSTFSINRSAGQTRSGFRNDNKGRKFFQQIQPTFSIDVSTNTSTKLEFLDNFDPAKDTVVRKKAREWVNRNREISNVSGQSSSKSKLKKDVALEVREGEKKQQLARRKSPPQMIIPSPEAISASSVDPFGLLPNIGREFDHIIKYCKALLDLVMLLVSDKGSSICKVSRGDPMLRWYVLLVRKRTSYPYLH